MKKYRLFGFINPVDILIVAGVAIFLVWAIRVFSAPQTASARRDDVIIRYVVELKEKEEGFFEKANAFLGASLFDSTQGFEIGTIVGAYSLPYLEDAPDAEAGIIRRAPVPGLEFSYIIVETPAQITEYATQVGQYEVLVNREIFVRSRAFAGQGYIVSIEVIG